MITDFLNNFISGRRYQRCANIIRDTDRMADYNNIHDKSIIWCKVNFVDELFSHIHNREDKYILITHNGDWSVDQSFFNKRPKCIKKWFAQNVDFKHEDLIPLPIGIENEAGPSKGSYTDYVSLNNNINNKPPLQNRILDRVYCNFSLNTHPSRINALNLLHRSGIGAIEPRRIDNNTYSSNMSKFMFISSPRGNGIDCHRTWEALYLGCIPIVEKHHMYDSYIDLPIIQINNWGEVNSSWLAEKRNEYMNKTFNYEKLDINYWLKVIESERDKL